MTATVFAVHAPTRWENRVGKMVAMDLSSAAHYGTLRIVFPGPQRPPRGDAAVAGLRAVLCNYTASDYLLVAGDMSLFTWAALLAARETEGQIRLLQWDRQSSQYVVNPTPVGLLCNTQKENLYG